MNAPFDAAAVAEEAVRRAARGNDQEQSDPYEKWKTDGDESPPDDEFIFKLPPNFTVSKGGVFHHTMQITKGEEKPTSEWVCAPLYVTAETRDEADESWGLLLEWKDRDGNRHKWSMPRKLLHEGSNPIAAQLENAGLSVGTDQREHNLLKQFLSGITVNRRLRCVSRTGWHEVNGGHVYVLSDTESFGPEAKALSSKPTASPPAPRQKRPERWRTGKPRLHATPSKTTVSACSSRRPSPARCWN
jgi:hypothetical protein